MTSLADKAILLGADNHPPTLEKDMYGSWKSIMELYMLNRQHGRMIHESVENGPLFWPSVKENGVTRLKKYSELSTTEAIQADCDVKATNILLQGLPPEVYALLEQFQVNTKFLNTLPPEWSKFVTDVKLVRDLHTTNVDQLYAYLDNTNIMEMNVPKGDDPIDAINHMMSFLTAVVTSRYPPTNNQLRTSSNPRQQATINNGRVTIQPIEGRQNSMTTDCKRRRRSSKRIKGKALKEIDDPEAFIFPIRLEGQVNENALADTGLDINTMPYRIYEQLGREDMKKVVREIMMINHTQAEAMGILINVLCQVGVTTLIAKFLIMDISIEHDSPIVVGRGFLRTIGGIVNTLEILFSTFDGFCHQTLRAARSDVMRNAESDSDDEEDYQIKRNKFGAPRYGPKPAPYLNCNDPVERSLAIQTPRKYASFVPKPHFAHFLGNSLNDEAGSSRSKRSRQHETIEENRSDEEIFPSVTWIRDFNFNEPIYAELCHEFYLLYEFDEVCADDKLQTKKIIKFRLGERAHSLTLLEFARSDEHFNAQDYWLNISREENLGLSRSHTSTIQKPILRVIHKMITYDLCQRTTGCDEVQKCDLWLLSMFDARHQNRKCMVLTEDVVRSLSALIYCRDLNTTTLRDLIDSDGKLILEDPQPGVPRVGIPRPLRASMQDLYDRIGFKELRVEFEGVMMCSLTGDEYLVVVEVESGSEVIFLDLDDEIINCYSGLIGEADVGSK
nr:hypothetical protein [Tanacetum cinerariifolium]